MPECAVCSSPAPHKCARCKCVFYCSPTHQREDWAAHKIQCPRLAQEALAAVFHPCDEELLLHITTCLAQNGYHKEVGIMVQLSKAFWWDEQIWDAFKDVPGGGKGGLTRLMFRAGIVGDLKRVRFLLDRGARVNKGIENNGMTALMGSSANSHLEVVRELCKRGANVNAARTDDGGTALISASLHGHLEVVRELCKRGANVNTARTDDGCTALMLASQAGHLEVVRELIGMGALVNAVTTDSGGNALMWASWGGHTKVVRVLLAHQSLVNIFATGNDQPTGTTPGITPLMLAAREGHKDTVRALLAGGADPLGVDTQGKTAHAFAMEKGNADICALLA